MKKCLLCRASWSLELRIRNCGSARQCFSSQTRETTDCQPWLIPQPARSRSESQASCPQHLPAPDPGDTAQGDQSASKNKGAHAETHMTMHVNIITPAAGAEANRAAGPIRPSRCFKDGEGPAVWERKQGPLEARCLGMLIDMFCEVASMIRIKRGDLPGGPVVRNLPSNAGDWV